jgi:uncharacterized protein
MSGLRIDVAELAGRPGASKEISRSEQIAGLRVPLGGVEEEDQVNISLLAESVIEGIAVSGTLEGKLHLSCSRCVVEFTEPFRHQVDETYFFTGDEEAYRVTANTIDLEPMVRDVVVLGIPPSPLHAPDCKGLCPVCGGDLNEVDCGHRQDLSDLRWAPLKALLSEEERG